MNFQNVAAKFNYLYHINRQSQQTACQELGLIIQLYRSCRMTKPKNYDVVMGGEQTPNLRGSLVLGGIDGVKRQLASASDQHRCDALYRALQYDQGKALVIKALQDPSREVRWTAYRLLMRLHEDNAISSSDDCVAQYRQHYPKFRFSGSNDVDSIAKEHLKETIEEELGQYSGAIVGTDFPLRVEQKKDTIADVVAIFPTGYMIAFMVTTQPIKPQELTDRSTAFSNSGVDVIWWLGEKANTPSNRKWAFDYYSCAYILNISKSPIGDNKEQLEVEFNKLSKYAFKNLKYKIREINWLLQGVEFEDYRNELTKEKESLLNLLQIGQSHSGMGHSILGRAIRQTFHAWKRLNNDQLKRGLLVQNKGIKSFGGVLGTLASHNHHSRITAIAKMSDGYWQVTDDKQLMIFSGFPENLFPQSGVKAMKKRAHAIAKIKATSETLMGAD